MRYADSCCQYTEELHPEHVYVFSGPCVVTGRVISVRVRGPELYAYRQGALIQDALVSNTPDEREFLLSGLSPEAFDAVVADDVV